MLFINGCRFINLLSGRFRCFWLNGRRGFNNRCLLFSVGLCSLFVCSWLHTLISGFNQLAGNTFRLFGRGCRAWLCLSLRRRLGWRLAA